MHNLSSFFSVCLLVEPYMVNPQSRFSYNGLEGYSPFGCNWELAKNVVDISNEILDFDYCY